LHAHWLSGSATPADDEGELVVLSDEWIAVTLFAGVIAPEELGLDEE